MILNSDEKTEHSLLKALDDINFQQNEPSIGTASNANGTMIKGNSLLPIMAVQQSVPFYK